jgi:hypothetical protein
MAGLFVEKSIWAFLFVTVIIGGTGAFLAGRATARAWAPFWRAAVSMLLLAAAVRFLHWGLFVDATPPGWREAQGALLSLHYYSTDALVLIVAAWFGWRRERTRQMTRQYHWLYRRTSPLTWTEC